jgi:hypothetical protein
LTTEVVLRDASAGYGCCGWGAGRPGASAGLELAGEWACADILLLRPEPSVRCGAAPRYRHRSVRRRRGRGAGLRIDRIRRHRPRSGEDDHDSDRRRLLRHARSPGLVLGEAGRPGLRARGGRHRGRNRRTGAPGAVRAPRRAAHGRAAGLHRPDVAAPRAGDEPTAAARLGRPPSGASRVRAAHRCARAACGGASTRVRRRAVGPSRADPDRQQAGPQVVRTECGARTADCAHDAEPDRRKRPARGHGTASTRASAGQNGPASRCASARAWAARPPVERPPHAATAAGRATQGCASPLGSGWLSGHRALARHRRGGGAHGRGARRQTPFPRPGGGLDRSYD